MQDPDRVAAVVGGRYRIERELGRGGMGIVYLAQDTQLDRRVAIKVLPSGMESDHAERFLREVRVLSSLQHPNIVPLLDAGTSDGTTWYSMPFVDGQSLRERLVDGALSADAAVSIVRDVASALDAAHGKGIVHRDVKPANILLTGDRASLADFGVARALGAISGMTGTLTQAGTAVGSPDYMAPEQIAMAAVDARADQFSLACVAYEGLTGRLPFGLTLGDSPASPAVLGRFTGAPTPLPPDKTLGNAQAVLLRALAPDAAARFTSCGEFAAALGAAVVARPVGQSTGRRRWRAAIVATLTVGVAAAAAVSYSSRRDAARDSIRLLVMPMRNDARTSVDWLAAGLTDELTSRLGRIPRLSVMARTTAARLANDPRPVEQIARKIAVRHVLTARLLPDADTTRLRVTTALVRASDGTEVWSESVPIDLRDIRAGEAQLVRRVAEGLRTTLGTDAVATPLATMSPEAYELVLEAGDATGAVYTWSGERVARAESLLTRAIVLDPRAVEAHARLAMMQVPHLWSPLSPRDFAAAVDRARRLAVNALRLDSTNVTANSAMAIISLADGSVDEARRQAERVLGMQPRHADALEVLGTVSGCTGDYETARRYFSQALESDPLNPDHASSLHVMELVGLGRAATARDLLQQNLELWESPGQRADVGIRLIATQLALGATHEQTQAAAQQERARRPAQWAWTATLANREVEWALAVEEDWWRVDSLFARSPARPFITMLRLIAANRWSDARRIAPVARAALTSSDAKPLLTAGWDRDLQLAWTHIVERDTIAAMAIVHDIERRRCGSPPKFGYEVALVTYPAIIRVVSGDTAGARRGLEAEFAKRPWPTREALKYHPILGPVLGFPRPPVP